MKIQPDATRLGLTLPLRDHRPAEEQSAPLPAAPVADRPHPLTPPLDSDEALLLRDVWADQSGSRQLPVVDLPAATTNLPDIAERIDQLTAYLLADYASA